MGSSFRLLRFALCGAFFTANVTTSGCDETSPPPDILGTSYELVATIETLEPSSAGAPGAYADRVPRTLPLTLRLDDASGADGTALLGGRGAATSFPYARRWEARDGSPGLVLPLETASCGSGEVTIETLHLERVDVATGAVTGTFTGKARVVIGDAFVDYAVSGLVSGDIDASTPILSERGPVDSPFRTLAFDASEPIAPGSTARLVGPAGFELALAARNEAEAVVGYLGAEALLPLGATLVFETSPALVDLAGRAATTLPTVTTPAAPGVFAADGFEGPVTANLASGAEIRTLTGTAYAITGERALWLSPGRALFQLSVPAGATKLAFAYRGVTHTLNTLPGDALAVRVGAGTTFLSSTKAPIPWGTYAAANDGSGSLVSQALTYEVPLTLAGITTLVVEVSAARPCGSPLESLVVDDLRLQ